MMAWKTQLQSQVRCCLLLVSLITMFPVNTGKLHVHTKVPDPFIFGSSADLYCNYSWDTADTLGTQGQPLHRKIYSLKWYKGHEEFFRYVPSEDEPIVKYNKSGVFVDVSRSNGHQVHLWKVNWFTKGLYRCEVTADDFETASSSVETEVVAVPTRDPLIEGQKTRYSVGDWVRLNCSSNASLPETELSWYVNSKEATDDMLIRYDRVREPSNLLTSTLGLKFPIGVRHSREGSVKVKCVAMLLQVYLKSHEISFEVKRPRRNLVPVLESRDKNGKSQSNNADLSLGALDFGEIGNNIGGLESGSGSILRTESQSPSSFFDNILNSSGHRAASAPLSRTYLLLYHASLVLMLLLASQSIVSQYPF